MDKNRKIVIEQTKGHIGNVKRLIHDITNELNIRAVDHDKSKLKDPELATFVEFTPKLRGCTFGSDEYKGYLEAMAPALDHHYANNRHHPQHFKDGIDGMNLVDIIEMLCDWKAATLRHSDGDLMKSIDINAKRFNMSDQLVAIFKNTAKFMEETNE